MFFAIIHIIIIVALALSVVSLVHVVQVLYETQVKMIKDQYRLRGQLDMIMGLVDTFSHSQVYNFTPEDSVPETIFEVNMDVKPSESVNSEHA